ncbi:Nn.00g039290.m01.CDS01 [Neocucurbitaria sp. VM-36]
MHVWYDRFEQEEVQCYNTFDIFDSVLNGKDPSQLSTTLSMSAENDDNKDAYICTGAVTLGANGDEDEDIPHDETEIPLHVLVDPNAVQKENRPGASAISSNRSTAQEEGYDSLQIDLAELFFPNTTVNGSSSQSTSHEDMNHDLEIGGAIDAVLEDQPFISQVLSSKTYPGSTIDQAWRLVLVGSFSRYPRILFGLEGNFSEFASGSFVMLNLFYAFVGYAYNGFFSKDTFERGWAEYLG